jgi:hypothetical protein
VHIDPLWLVHLDGASARLARSLYDDRQFDDLPILGDALEEAGCDDEYLLGHLRRRGGHFRGCWALDLLLAKQ